MYLYKFAWENTLPWSKSKKNLKTKINQNELSQPVTNICIKGLFLTKKMNNNNDLFLDNLKCYTTCAKYLKYYQWLVGENSYCLTDDEMRK